MEKKHTIAVAGTGCSYGEEITRTFSDEFIIREGSFFYLLVYSIKVKMPLGA